METGTVLCAHQRKERGHAVKNDGTGSGVQCGQKVAVALSSVAALIHLLVTPEHFGEWWGYGTFMLAAFVAQAIYAAALLVWPGWKLLLLAGVIGNLTIIGMWAVSRTVGIPLGPETGEVEGIGALDLVCTASEATLVVVLMVLLNLYRRGRVARAQGR
jgi:hypothetical protein